MAKIKTEHNTDLPEKTKSKIDRREKKKKPKMRISGKRVFQLKEIKKRKI